MYEFISADGPREQYADLVRSREQERLERRIARETRHARVWPGRRTWGFLARRRVAAVPIVSRAVGAQCGNHA